jgi:hypothetical protein
MTQVNRRQVLKGIGLGAAGVLIGPTAYVPSAALAEGRRRTRHRWDIVNIFKQTPPCAEAGGESSSKSLDGARITLTGSGTFREGPVGSKKVTGGGDWTITAGSETPPGSGTYKVVRFVSFEPAPGTIPIADCIGDAEDAHAGRLTVAIRFDDHSEGVLEIGCRLAGSPGSIMEGITATKGFVTFWNHEEPEPGVDGNRTLFHVLRRRDDDDDEDD